jgi:DNA-binding NarL/FixJ family response regulator
MGQTCPPRVTPEVKLYLLAENRLLRDTLTRLLGKRSEISVVGVNRISTTSKEEIASAHCDVLLTDCFDSPSDSAFLFDVLREKPEMKLVLFGMNDDPDTFLKAAFLGTCGYMLKDASLAEMVAAVLAAVRNEATCPPNLCLSLIQYLQKRRAPSLDLANDQDSDKKALTPRQLQLIQLVANGLTNKEIASNLHLSEFTVKNHIRRVMRRVDADTRYAAVDVVRAAGHLPIR